MKNLDSNPVPEAAENLEDIITIQHAISDNDDFDYDFDYDPNEMYYALNGDNQL